MGYEKTGRLDCDSRIERERILLKRGRVYFDCHLLLETGGDWVSSIGPKWVRNTYVNAAVFFTSRGDLWEVLLHYLAIFINKKDVCTSNEIHLNIV